MTQNSSAVGQVSVELALGKKNFNNDVNRTLRNTENAFNTSFKKIGAVIATAFSTKVVFDFGRSAVQAASDAQAAWTGLNSIVQGTGKNFGVAKKFLTEFTKDGLVGIEDAATAYKNLLARGYDTTQIENVMTRLKDSAAFGRQSSYTLSQAVVSATEGLKNENSILVDNAGVTKNVAKMWEEYADSIGKTANNLTQQEKIQAEVNGIMKETAFQAGDAATYTNTFAGKVQVLKGAFSSMKTAIGKVVAPIVGLFIPAITSAINAITAFFNKLASLLSLFGLDFPDVVEKTSSGISNIGNSASATADNIASTGDAASKAAKKIKKAFSGVDEINVLNTSKDSKSDGGSGGSDGIGDIGGAIDKGEDPISSAVKSTADKIMKYIKPLQDIKLDNLINAFGILKESVKELGGTIWQGLEWAYFNLLVPLAEWTIEDALPAFFYALSGALDAVSGILQEAYPVLDWLWQNFLKPIASWTGDVIVSALYGLGDALKWVGENANIVVGAMVGIGAAWATFKAMGILGAIVQFVSYSGKLAGATTIIGSLGAAISQLWTYFKAGTIVTKVTGWFSSLSGAFTAVASAVGISAGALAGIIGVVAAVAAGAYLLITNWDEVKKFFTETLPNKISEAFDWLGKKWDEFTGWLSELPGKIGYWFGYGLGKIVKFFGEDVPNAITKFFTETVPKAWNSFTTWAKEIPSKLETFFTKTIPEKWAKLQTWFEGLPDKLMEIGRNIIDGLINGITTAWENTKKAVKDFVDGFVKGFKDALGIHSPSTVFAEMGGNLIEGLWQGINKLKKWIADKWETVKGWFSDITKEAKVAIKQKWNDIKDKWTELTKNIKEKTADMKAKVATTWSNIKSKWTSITNNIKDKTADMKAKIGTTWSQLKSKWNSLMSNFKDKTVTIKTKIGEVVGNLKQTINDNIIKKINNKLPSIFPKIPYLAQGGWFKANNPTLAVVGDNKHEPEITAPESKIYDQTRKAVEDAGGTNTNQHFDLTIKLEYPDGKYLIKEINNAQIRDGRLSLLV